MKFFFIMSNILFFYLHAISADFSLESTTTNETQGSVLEEAVSNSFIVRVDDEANLQKVMREIEKATGGKILHVYTDSIRGFAIELPEGVDKSVLFSHEAVIDVEPDLVIKPMDDKRSDDDDSSRRSAQQENKVLTSAANQYPASGQHAQILTSGIGRINVMQSRTANVNNYDNPLSVNIAIIDTGIDSRNPDLNVVFSKSFVSGNSSGEDDNGHGTHVAGVAAARDNGIGVVGVAPGARLYSLKVLDHTGSGALSNVIKAVDWVAGASKTKSSSKNSAQKNYDKYMKKYEKEMKKFEKYLRKYNDYYYTRYNKYYQRYLERGRDSDLRKAERYRARAPRYLERAYSYKAKAEGYKQQAEQYLGSIGQGASNPNKIDVVNMSLGAQGVNRSLQRAIQKAVDRGVVFVVSAGNNFTDIYGGDRKIYSSDDIIPAAYPEVVTVSAMADSDGRSGGLGPYATWFTLDDTIIAFSNHSASVGSGNPVVAPGKGIDVAGPGIDIYSTWLRNGFAVLSGTSMAAPHVTGAFALLIAKLGQDVNRDGNIDGRDVVLLRQIVIDTAQPQRLWRQGSTRDPDGNLEGVVDVSSF